MKTLFDYLDYYGDASFNELAFNDVDSLILTQLSYVKINEILKTENMSKSIREICTLFLSKYSEKDFKKEDYLFPNSYRLMLALQSSKRFMNAIVSNYIKDASGKTQFGAMTIRFLNGICFISYEGTDSSILGWKEDLELMYEYPTLAQKRGKEYLEKTVKVYDRTIYIGGHSKGGNTAMYAFMNVRSSLKRRIKAVYNFDGPGFLEEVTKTKPYKELKEKLKMFVPEQSVVGMIFEHPYYEVVKSHGLGVLQHDAFTWCCFGGKFELGTLSKKSEKLENNLKEYLKTMTIDDRKLLVSTVDKVCKDLGIKNVMQIREVNFMSIVNFVKELKTVPEAMKKRVLEIIKLLFL